MADETEEIKVSPLIPTLKDVQLEIDGELRRFNLRYDMLASYKIAKEGRGMGEDYDTYMSIAVTVKNFLWPRDHGLTSEQILEGLSVAQTLYLNAKIRELLALNKVEMEVDDDGNPTVARLTEENSPTSIGGNSKQALDSASGSPSPNSGTQTRVN